MTRKPPRSTSGQVSAPAPRVRRTKATAAKKRKKAIALDTQLEKLLHEAVVRYGNHYELGAHAGVSADVLSRFARKERNLRLDTAGRVAHALGLGLTLTDEA